MRIKKTSETRPLGATVVNAYDNSQINAYSTQYCNQTFGGTLLWTNPNPTSSMAQDVSIVLNSSDYDIYEVFYTATSTSYWSSAKSTKGNGVCLPYGGYPAAGILAGYRGLTYVDDTHLKTGTAFYVTSNSSSSNNTYCIPQYIVGYKTSLFS